MNNKPNKQGKRRTRFIKHIKLENKNLPYKWMETLVSNGKIGGVMLVFVEGFSETEINTKVKLIKEFCEKLKQEEFKEEEKI